MEFIGIVLIIYVIFKVVSWINSGNTTNNNTTNTQTPRPQTPRPKTPRPQTPRPKTPRPQKYSGDDILINIGVLGMLISKVDGRLLDREKQLVFNWIKNKTSASFAETKINEINNYVRYISESTFDDTKMKSEINHYLRILKTDCSLSMKYEVLLLYIDVIIVDDILHNKEKAAIYHIAKNIGVDMDKFLELFHDKLPKALLESAIDASTLGILPRMTDNEKKKILREQYRKWADLVTSDDETTRRKAEIMLEVISKERLKLKEKP